MKIEDINLFLEICKNNSITHTAKINNISQQRLSAVIRRVEKEIGEPLFVRNTQGVHLTQYGVLFQKYAINIHEQVESFFNDIDALKRTSSSILNIGVSCGVLSSLPSGFWEDFKKLHPNIIVNITEYQDQQCEEKVLDETEDIGFNINPIDQSVFNAQIIVKNKMCILVNKNHRLAKKDTVDILDLKDEKLLVLNKNFKLRHNFEKKCHESGFHPNIVLETMELILIHNFSKLNKGIGIGVHFIGSDIPDVKAIPFKDKTCTWEVCVITSKSRPVKLETQQFLDYISTIKFFNIK